MRCNLLPLEGDDDDTAAVVEDCWIKADAVDSGTSDNAAVTKTNTTLTTKILPRYFLSQIIWWLCFGTAAGSSDKPQQAPRLDVYDRRLQDANATTHL
mmetsp:Transcript_25919/g.54500  ORF Transcript_25919/g.54500 Transcript_25919/m.54500 type:complete len:98 (+) Transcript_25919:277-570(+)